MGPSGEALPSTEVRGAMVGVGSEAVWVVVARAVALAEVLPGVKVRGGAGGAGVQRWLAQVRREPAGVGARELAGVLVDAQAMSRLVGSGAAERAQRRAVRRVTAVMGLVPAGLVPAEVVRRAVDAVGAAARLRSLAEELGRPEYAVEVDRLAEELAEVAGAAGESGVGRAGRVAELLSDEVVSDARSAAVVRAAAAALADCEPEIEAAAEVMAGQLRQRSAMVAGRGGDVGAAVRERLAAAGQQRGRRAAELVDKLLTGAGAVDRSQPSAVPGAWPSDPRLLSWLRSRIDRRLHSPAVEQALARRWLGADPFGLRVLPGPPLFLAGVPVTGLPAGHVAPLLRRISLTRPAPTAAEVSTQALDADVGPVSTVVRGRRLRRWGQPAGTGAPLLPRRTRVPHVVHGIWLGRPMPASSVFWRNYAAGARRYAGRVDFVLWTDIPRSRFAAALAGPPPAGQADPLAEVRALLEWAQENGILLVNVFEVFHARAPMRLHAQFVLEMCKQLPRGFASASDHLRVEIIHRFGGLYADGDISFLQYPEGGVSETRPELVETLPEFFDRLAASTPGFTMDPMGGGFVNNDMLGAPAGHPAVELWLECARTNYFQSQSRLFGGVAGMAQGIAGPWRQGRYIAPLRTGRIHHRVLALLGIPAQTLPATQTAVRIGSEASWVPPTAGEPAVAGRRLDTDDDVAGTLARCLTFLQWQLAAREGNLYLSAVDPVIRGLPDPDAAWIALLRVLPAISAGLPPVTSVTDLRRNDDGRLEAVQLPPEAAGLLNGNAAPAAWLGAPLSAQGQPIWLLDERVAPATLRTTGQPAHALVNTLLPLAEIVVNAFGHPIGLWLRSPHAADRGEHHRRFTTLPAGHFGVHLGTSHREGIQRLNLHPETVTTLLLRLGATAGPIHLTVPPGTLDTSRPFAARLQHLLGQPVHLSQPRHTDMTQPRHSQLPPVHHLPLAAFIGRGSVQRSTAA